jgi:hypothetical protein
MTLDISHWVYYDGVNLQNRKIDLYKIDGISDTISLRDTNAELDTTLEIVLAVT